MIDSTLTDGDMHFVLTRIPKDVLDLIKKEAVFLGGGFIREIIAGNKPNDIDLFGSNKDVLRLLAEALAVKREARVHSTDNAITLIAPPRLPVQFITRWCYDDPVKLAGDFDFTVCQAVIWYDKQDGCFKSAASNRFYSDLAARRLHYTSPMREEAAGGSMLRVRKFLQRGYTIQALSLAGVVARLVMKVDMNKLPDGGGESAIAQVVGGLLHEVDPLLIVDGFEPKDEHEPITEMQQ